MSHHLPQKNHWRVEVLWEDTTIWHSGWEQVDEVLSNRTKVHCLSVGFVLADDKDGIVLGASVHGSEVAGVTMIPRSQVIYKKRLSPSRTPVKKIIR